VAGVPNHAPVLQVRDLAVSFPGRAGVLNRVDLDVAHGEKVGVVGPNGAGKTTLFLSIAGVVEPDRGSIEIAGNPVVPGRFRPDVGLVFQNPDHQLFCSSVAEDVAFGPRNLGLDEAEVARRVAAAMEIVGAGGLEDRVPHHLSGGERRMVSIATVMALEPALVIYDEPSANLDIRSRRRLVTYLQGAGQTQLIASHDLELILEVCPRAVLLDEGQVVADGPTRELMNDPELMGRHGLERPHSLIPHAEPHHHHHD
jgi:cobalt/nickel transport system ATP-binding protein